MTKIQAMYVPAQLFFEMGTKLICETQQVYSVSLVYYFY